MLDPAIVREIEDIVAEPDLDRKLRAAMQLTARTRDGGIGVAGTPGDAPPVSRRIRPGRPADWRVLPPGELRDRPRLGSARGRYLLLHSVAHIELSAVELALLSSADFPEQPDAYHREILAIAREEVVHTRMLLQRLRELGGELGSDPVHLALFDTARDHQELPARLAVVPRILEARGLDVS
ncbi:MAG: DUF455 family protein, partial [Candidatus Eisenbacteria bacterium]|nr:DUF455 family protein [Candidatus Eisenbacteria bacterium]